MYNEYIANYDVFANGYPAKWGNCAISIRGRVTAGEVCDEIRKTAAKETGCEEKDVRILGVFKL